MRLSQGYRRIARTAMAEMPASIINHCPASGAGEALLIKTVAADTEAAAQAPRARAIRNFFMALPVNHGKAS